MLFLQITWYFKGEVFQDNICIILRIHSWIKFLATPHQIGSAFFSILCGPSRLSWQYFVKTWQNPVATKSPITHNKNGFYSVALHTGNGDISLLGRSARSRESVSSCAITLEDGTLWVNQNSVKGHLLQPWGGSSPSFGDSLQFQSRQTDWRKGVLRRGLCDPFLRQNDFHKMDRW